MIRRRVIFAGTSAWLALLTLAIAVPVCAEQTREQSRQTLRNVSELIQKVKSLPDSQDRRDAARELSTIEPLPPEALQALADVIETTQHNGAVERYAMTALAKAGAPAIPAFTTLLESKNPQAREAAIETLGRIRDPVVWPILIGTFNRASNPLTSGPPHINGVSRIS